VKDVTYLFRQRSSRISTITSNFPSYSIWGSFKNNTAKNMEDAYLVRLGKSQDK